MNAEEQFLEEAFNEFLRVAEEAKNSLNRDINKDMGDIKMLIAQWKKYIDDNKNLTPEERRIFQNNIDKMNAKYEEILLLLLQLYKYSIKNIVAGKI